MSEIRTIIQTDAALKQIEAALPSHVKPETYRRVLLTILNKTPKLASCTKESVLNAMMDCASLGLEPNGREAHLIPYGNQCQLIVDYKGLIKLAYQSGRIRSIHAGVVYEGDEFDYAECHHIPHGWLPDPKSPDRGNCIGAFVIIEKKGGSIHRERMTFDEIESVRKRSKASKSGPWVTDWDEMAKKTVFRRATKWIELSSEHQAIIEKDFDSLPPIAPQAGRVQPAESRILDVIGLESADNSDPDDELPTYPDAE